MSQLVKTHPHFFNLNLKSKNIYPGAVVFILILAVGLRFIGLDKGIWIDERMSLRWLEKTDDFGELILALRDYDKPPLYFLLLYLWSKLNNSLEFLRSFSIIFDLGTIAAVIAWLRRYSSQASILAGLYFTVAPILLRYSQEIRPYSLLLFATALAFFCASRIAAEPEKPSGYIGLSLSLTLAVSTHLVGVMLMPALAIFIILMAGIEKQKIHWMKGAVTFAIPCFVFGFFYFFYLTTLTERTENWWMPPCPGL